MGELPERQRPVQIDNTQTLRSDGYFFYLLREDPQVVLTLPNSYSKIAPIGYGRPRGGDRRPEFGIAATRAWLSARDTDRVGSSRARENGLPAASVPFYGCHRFRDGVTMGSFVYYRRGPEGRYSGLNTVEARRVLSLLPGNLLVEVCLRPVVDASMRQRRFHIENGQEPAMPGIADKEINGSPLTVSGLLQAAVPLTRL